MERRLLVIEDDPSIADLVVEVATGLGIKARGVTNTAKLEKICKDAKPDLIVLDIMMPERDGFEVLTYLRDNHPDVKIIILSGQDSYRDMVERIGHSQGQDIVATMRKPFRVDQLREVFAQSLKLLGESDLRHRA